MGPKDRKLAPMVKYRMYRLKIISHRDEARRRGRSFHMSLGTKKRNKSYMFSHLPFSFSGKDLLTVLEFLMLFVDFADSIQMDEHEAYIILPHALAGKARNHLNAGKCLGR